MSKCERFAQVTQDKWATVRELLRSLMTNVAHDKWVNVSDSLRSLRTNEWIDRFFEQIDHFYLSLPKNKRLAQKKIFLIIFFVRFLQYFLKSKSFAHSFWAKWANRSGCSGQMSDRKRFAQVAQKEWAIVSKLLRSLTKKWANEQITHFLSKLLICSLFWQKTSDSLQNSMSEFPTLWIWGSWKFVYITHTIKKLLGKEKKKF